MAMSTPDWLRLHGGEFLVGKDGLSGSIYFAGDLQYILIPVPAKGTFGCRISETNNGCRIDGDAIYPSFDAALNGGLEQLRSRLGW